MTFHYVRRSMGPAIFACAVAHASFGCSGNKPAKAQAYVSAAITAGNNSVSLCGFSADQTVVSVGTTVQFPKPMQLPVAPTSDGDFSPGSGTAHIQCSVSGGGNSFDITLSAAVDGMGSFSVLGKVDGNANGTGVIANFAAQNNGAFRSSNCTVSPMFMGGSVPVSGSPVTGGRIFAHIDCPDAMNMLQSGIADDGGITNKTCDAHADFLFQNCD
jgi:hypothetical protein